VIGALAVLLCLSCSWSSSLIVANMSANLLTIRAHHLNHSARTGELQIRFARVRAMSDWNAWRPAPPSAVTLDTSTGFIQIVLPPGTAADIANAFVCDAPATCDGFPLASLELSGSEGSVFAEGEPLRAVFSRESKYDWIAWYPVVTAHGIGRNLDGRRAAVFCMTVVMAVFALWAAVVVARTPMPKRWGWAAIALLGVGELALNWTTGEVTTSLLAFPLPGASMTRSSLAGPWMVVVSFPVGAIIALLKRDRAQRMQNETGPSTMPMR
jgi:hypothetical protein